jgi:hypothetical protein
MMVKDCHCYFVLLWFGCLIWSTLFQMGLNPGPVWQS